jgi:outer membrane PBP1 activator LpoA protein
VISPYPFHDQESQEQMPTPNFPTPVRVLAPALLTLVVAGCANLAPQGEPTLPVSAKYPKDQTVALLLPTSAEGFVKDAVDAIEAGYAAARSREPKVKPTYSTKDTWSPTRGDTSAAEEAYAAITREASRPLVIGPLLKHNVEAVAGARDAAAPAMLALNELAGSSRTGLYQFALAPEDEARTVADVIKQMQDEAPGLADAMVVYPAQDDWGERMRSAFAAGMRGKAVREVAYSPDSAQSLGAMAAEAAGADVIFMIARPMNAVKVYDALRGAGAKAPVIATSHAADTEDDKERMEDLFVVDVPWLLGGDAASRFAGEVSPKPAGKHRKGSLGRLYAMGIDAYYLGAAVANRDAARGKNAPLTLPQGMTGSLTFPPNGGLVSRRLALGQIGDDGKVTPAMVDELAAAAKSAAASGTTAERSTEADGDTDEG